MSEKYCVKQMFAGITMSVRTITTEQSMSFSWEEACHANKRQACFSQAFFIYIQVYDA